VDRCVPTDERTLRAPRGKTSKVARIYLKALWAVLIPLLPFGVFLVVVTLHQRALTQPIAGGAEARGAVIGWKEESGGNAEGLQYSPIIEFTDTRGRRVVFVAEHGSDKPTVGESVRVSYRPDEPQAARDISDHGVPWLEGLLLAVFIAVLGAWIWWRLARSRWRRRVHLADPFSMDRSRGASTGSGGP
jgi:hypothetical protein